MAQYQAGASMARLKAEHHMAKRTVAKVLRDTGIKIRSRGDVRGGRPRSQAMSLFSPSPIYRTLPTYIFTRDIRATVSHQYPCPHRSSATIVTSETVTATPSSAASIPAAAAAASAESPSYIG